MSKGSRYLAAVLPRCRHCGRHWRPVEGVVASDAYCPLCSEARRTIAAAVFDAGPIPALKEGQRYILPREMRAT